MSVRVGVFPSLLWDRQRDELFFVMRRYCCINSFAEGECWCLAKNDMCQQLLGTCPLDVKGVDSCLGERRVVSRECQLSAKDSFLYKEVTIISVMQIHFHQNFEIGPSHLRWSIAI